MNPSGMGSTPREHLRDVVDYAIQREQEAIDFYNDVAGRVQNRAVAEELRKLAAMEQGHREWLRRMDVSVAVTGPARQVLDLKIADYVVEVEPAPAMTWQDVVNMGMHRELASMKLYADLAEKVDEPAARQLFEKLAAEEAVHKLFFERIWDEEILMWN